MKPVLSVLTVLTALPAAARDCTFTTECYEAEACAQTQFSVTISDDAATLVTDFGDLAVVFAEGPVLVAQDANATYLLTTLPEGARLSTQVTGSPMVVTYLGQCEAPQ